MPKFIDVALSIPLALMIAATGHAQSTDQPSGPAIHGPRPILFVSPAGVPFRGKAEDGDVMPPEIWFKQADSDSDGKLSRAEFREDFNRAFALFDVNSDAIIDHYEIVNYEDVIFPEIKTSSLGGGERPARPDGNSGRKGRGGGPGGGGDAVSSGSSSAQSYDPSMLGAARFGYLAIPQPLLSADPQLRRRISVDDYLGAADRRFGLLDDKTQGFLVHSELIEKLPKRGPRGKPKQRR